MPSANMPSHSDYQSWDQAVEALTQLRQPHIVIDNIELHKNFVDTCKAIGVAAPEPLDQPISSVTYVWLQTLSDMLKIGLSPELRHQIASYLLKGANLRDHLLAPRALEHLRRATADEQELADWQQAIFQLKANENAPFIAPFSQLEKMLLLSVFHQVTVRLVVTPDGKVGYASLRQANPPTWDGPMMCLPLTKWFVELLSEDDQRLFDIAPANLSPLEHNVVELVRTIKPQDEILIQRMGSRKERMLDVTHTAVNREMPKNSDGTPFLPQLNAFSTAVISTDRNKQRRLTLSTRRRYCE